MNPGFYRHQAGPFVVTALYDGGLSARPDILLGMAAGEAEALLAKQFRGPMIDLHINAYLVQGDGRTVLIDTGAGGLMGPDAGWLLKSLAAAGVSPDAVDAVLLTHFHADHSGGLTTAEGAAVFSRAELLIPPGEAAYWFDPAAEAAATEARQKGFGAARAAAAPYRDRLREIETEAFPGITRLSLPGHTPGHSGWMIGHGADAVLVWGDVMHVPDIQAARPDVGLIFDVDPDLAAQTRHAILAKVAEERILVAGMHLHFPGLCHVARSGEGYRIVPIAWQPTP